VSIFGNREMSAPSKANVGLGVDQLPHTNSMWTGERTVAASSGETTLNVSALHPEATTRIQQAVAYRHSVESRPSE